MYVEFCAGFALSVKSFQNKKFLKFTFPQKEKGKRKRNSASQKTME